MQEDQDHWWMLLRCGACGHRYDAIVCDETAHEFDTKLDRDLARIAIGAERLHRQWRKAEVDAFAAALDRDLIGADDFAH
jgi:hypothetical protein